MRVLFVTRKWPPAVGGMETYSVELVAELRRLGLDVDLRALPGRPDGGAPGAAAIASFGLRTALALASGRGGWDAVHGGDMAVWPLALLGRLRSPRAALVLSAHGTDVAFAERPGLAARLYRGYLRLGARLRPQVVANSDATGERARTLGFRDVAVVPLASRERAPEGSCPPGRYLLFAGRLVRRKGLAWFVAEVLPGLAPDIRLLVAGTDWDAGESAALADPRVEFRGAVGQDRLAALMAGALAVVIPNLPAGPGHFEGFGLVAVEAAMAGGLVLAPRLDGFTSSVVDGETGRLLPPADAAAWQDAIAELAEWTPEHRAAVGARARRHALEHFAWERVARETAAFYGDGPPPPAAPPDRP